MDGLNAAVSLVDEIKRSQLRRLQSIENFRERKIVETIDAGLFREPRIKLLRGLRGTGKTTIMLQLLKKHQDKGIYFSADSPQIKGPGIYKSAKELIAAGCTLLLIDEVHTIPAWRSEIKALYDEFSDIEIVCSGSAPLALIPERREKEYTIHSLTFSEYIFLKEGVLLDSENAWQDKNKSVDFVIRNEDAINRNFKNYISHAAFPIALSYGPEDAINAIYSTIRKSVHEDAPAIIKCSMEKIYAMERLLIRIATSPPGETNYTSLSKELGISKSTVFEIITAMVEMKLLRLIKPASERAMAKAEPKILFYHPNLRASICQQLRISPGIGAIREEAVLFGLEKLGFSFNTIRGMKRSPDYLVKADNEEIVIEIGGEGKNSGQLREFKEKFKTLIIGEDQLKALLMCSK